MEKKDWVSRIVKGAGLIALAHIFATSIAFISRILIIRHLSQSYFGIYSLGLALVNIFVIVSCLGLTQGITRQISYHKETDSSKVPILMGSSVLIVLSSAIVSSLFFFFFAEKIATILFHEPLLVQPLRIFSLAIPPVALVNVLISIYRGHSKAKPRLYFGSIGRNIVFLSGLFLIVIFGLSIDAVIYAYFFSFLTTAILLLFYTKYSTNLNFEIDLSSKVLKNLLFFSLPLLISSFLWLLMNWTDTIVVGFYLPSEEVGLYEGAFSFAKNIPLFLGFVGFLNLPSLSSLYGKKELSKMKGIYQTLTRWIFYISVPIFFVFILFPDFILGFFFGAEYAAAGNILRVLSVGFIFHTIVGNNALGLISAGERKAVVTGNLIGLCFNLALNFALIPFLGILGAALASMVSYISSNIYESTLLFQKVKISPLTGPYLKSLAIVFFLIPLFYFLKSLIETNLLTIAILSICYILSCLVLLSVMDCLGEEEIDLLTRIEERFGINLEIIKKFCK